MRKNFAISYKTQSGSCGGNHYDKMGFERSKEYGSGLSRMTLDENIYKSAQDLLCNLKASDGAAKDPTYN